MSIEGRLAGRAPAPSAPATLFQLALELDRLTPLHIETNSKAARGYALTSGEPPAWHKAVPLALERDATVGTALEAILRDCLRHWTTKQGRRPGQQRS